MFDQVEKCTFCTLLQRRAARQSAARTRKTIDAAMADRRGTRRRAGGARPRRHRRTPACARSTPGAPPRCAAHRRIQDGSAYSGMSTPQHGSRVAAMLQRNTGQLSSAYLVVCSATAVQPCLNPQVATLRRWHGSGKRRRSGVAQRCQRRGVAAPLAGELRHRHQRLPPV